MRLVEVGPANVQAFTAEARQGRWVVCHYMNGCMHCHLLQPAWEEAVAAVQGVDGLNVARVEQQFTQALPGDMNKILAFPSIVQYDHGRPVREFRGMRSADNLARFLRESAAPPKKRGAAAASAKKPHPAPAKKRGVAPAKKKKT